MTGKDNPDTITCPGCGTTATTTMLASPKMDAVPGETGFKVVLCDDCTHLWLCPACYARCQEHVAAVMAITRNPRTHLRTFVHRDKSKDGP